MKKRKSKEELKTYYEKSIQEGHMTGDFYQWLQDVGFWESNKPKKGNKK